MSKTPNNQGLLKIAAVSPLFRTGAPRYNAGEIARHIINANSRGAGLVVFPELAVGGAGGGRLYLHPRFLSECEEALSLVLSASKGRSVIAVFGMPLAVDGMVFNAALAVCGGEILAITAKESADGLFAPLRALPPSVTVLNNPVEAGKLVLKARGLSINIAVGENAVFPPDTAVAVNISSAPALLGFEEGKKLQAMLFGSGIYVYVSDCSPYEYGDGSGLKIISECGRPAASAGSDTEAVFAEVSLGATYTARLDSPESRHIGVELRTLPKLRAHPYRRTPFAPTCEREILSAFDILVGSLHSLMRRAGCNGLSLDMTEDAPSYAALALLVKLSAKFGLNRRNFHVRGGGAAEKYGFAEEGNNPVLSVGAHSFTERALGIYSGKTYGCYPFALTPLTTLGSLASFFCRCEKLPPALAYPDTAIPPELADFLIHQLFGMKTDSPSAISNAAFAFPEFSRPFITESCGKLLQTLARSAPPLQPAFKLHDFPFEHLLSAQALYSTDFFY